MPHVSAHAVTTRYPAAVRSRPIAPSCDIIQPLYTRVRTRCGSEAASVPSSTDDMLAWRKLSPFWRIPVRGPNLECRAASTIRTGHATLPVGGTNRAASVCRAPAAADEYAAGSPWRGMEMHPGIRLFHSACPRCRTRCSFTRAGDAWVVSCHCGSHRFPWSPDEELRKGYPDPRFDAVGFPGPLRRLRYLRHFPDSNPLVLGPELHHRSGRALPAAVSPGDFSPFSFHAALRRPRVAADAVAALRQPYPFASLAGSLRPHMACARRSQRKSGVCCRRLATRFLGTSSLTERLHQTSRPARSAGVCPVLDRYCSLVVAIRSVDVFPTPNASTGRPGASPRHVRW